MDELTFNLQLFADEGGEVIDETISTDGASEVYDTPIDDDVSFDYGLDKDGNLIDLTDEHSEPETPSTDLEPTEAQEKPQEQAPEQTCKINIGGQEFEVPVSQMQAAYQQQMQVQAQQQAQQQQASMQQQQVTQQSKFAEMNQKANTMAAELLRQQGVDVAEMDDWDPMHQAAKQFAMNQIMVEQAQQQFVQQQRRTQVEQIIAAEQATEPNFLEIDQFATHYLDTLPYGQAKAITERMQAGDLNAVCQLYSMAKQEYYRQKNNITPAQTTQQKRVEPVKLESAGGNNPTVPTKMDFSKLGSMTTEQQAAFLLQAGLVD